MPSRLSEAEEAQLIEVLRARFEANRSRHPDLSWATVTERLEKSPSKLRSLHEMERTGGEPDVVVFSRHPERLFYVDCSQETPSGRRSLCYDEDALKSRKEHPPVGSAMGMAQAMEVALLTEAEYFDLQHFGEFDLKTSSWLKTPAETRALGGALFGDRRYDRVFIYHNGVQSYYASRGFRAILEI